MRPHRIHRCPTSPLSKSIACAACGAQAEWNPSKQLLVCPFCGTAAPFTVDPASGALVENDLAKALRELPDEARGWLTEKRTVQCQSCKAVSVFDPERVGQNCDFCGSPALVDYKEIKAPIRPQGLLPFKISESQVREQIRRWYASKWLAPGTLKSRALVDRVRGVYIPYWTFDAQAVCPWEAEAGHYYYTTETYRDNQGRQRDAAGAARAVGAGVGGRPAFLRRRAGARDAGCFARPARAGRAVPDDRARSRTTPRFCPASSSSTTRSCCSMRRRRRRSAMTGKLSRCGREQMPGDTYRNLRDSSDVFRRRPSSTCSCRCGCCRTSTARRAYQVVVNG